MTHRTAPAPPTADLTEAPPDIATMRAVVHQLLAENAPPPAKPAVTVMQQMRGHIELLIAEVQAGADRLPKDDIPRYCALACVGEARHKMGLPASSGPAGELALARRLARVLNALCDHYENLGGVRS